MIGTAYASEDQTVPSKVLTITPQASNHLIGESVAISGKYVYQKRVALIHIFLFQSL